MALTVAALQAATGLAVADAARLLVVVVETCERYAPDAPQALRDEAGIRLTGWLADTPSAAVRSERVGDVMTSYLMPGRSSPMLASGAAALLSPYRIRRAGVIE